MTLPVQNNTYITLPRITGLWRPECLALHWDPRTLSVWTFSLSRDYNFEKNMYKRKDYWPVLTSVHYCAALSWPGCKVAAFNYQSNSGDVVDNKILLPSTWAMFEHILNYMALNYFENIRNWNLYFTHNKSDTFIGREGRRHLTLHNLDGECFSF